MFNSLNPLKPVKSVLKQVNGWAEQMAQLDDQSLKDKTTEFRERLDKGESLDDLLPEAYAVVREVAKRVLGMFPYDVQVMGAIVMHQGNIAEMSTGEGKTLTATMPVYLNALTGQGAILVTTNEYLAKRDAEEMGQVYEFLGLTIGVPFTEETQDKILELLAPSYIEGFSLLGGEPFEPENQPVLAELLEEIRRTFPDKSIWCYSGYLFDKDMVPGGKVYTPFTDRMLSCIDVLVDGEFIQELKNLSLQFRGSSNQRILHLKDGKLIKEGL